MQERSRIGMLEEASMLNVSRRRLCCAQFSNRPAHLRAAVDRLDGLTATPAVAPSPVADRAPMAHEMAQNGILARQSQVASSQVHDLTEPGGVAKWSRRRSAKPLFGGSNPPAAFSIPFGFARLAA